MAEEATSVPTGAPADAVHLSTPRQYSQRACFLHHCYSLPPAQWLKTKRVYTLTGLEVGSLEGAASPGSPSGDSPLLSPSSQGPPARLGLWPLPPAPGPAL